MDWSGTGYRTAIYNRQRFVYPNSVIADPANPGKYTTNTTCGLLKMVMVTMVFGQMVLTGM